MKKTIYLALFVLPSMAFSQIVIADDSSYATADTTAWASCDFETPYILDFIAEDSCNVSIVLQYRSALSPATVFQSFTIEADSTNSVEPTGFWKSYLLRAGATDNIPGAERVRLIVTPKTTKNGTTTPNYTAKLKEN